MVEPVPIQLKSVDLGEQSSELDLKAQRIKEFDPYIQTPREQAYFDWLKERKAVLHSGVVFTSDDVGLAKASQVYRAHYSKQKGGLYRIPMPVLYVEMHDPGRPRDVFITLLEGLGHQFRFGPLRDLRKRTWATLRDFRVEMILVNHADSLTFEAMKELVYIKTHCKISTMLLGDCQLKEILSRRKYTGIYNHFLNFHSFRPLAKPEFQLVIQAWEQMSCDFAPSLGLKGKESLAFLYERTGGLVEPLYDVLKGIAYDRLLSPNELDLTLEQLSMYCAATFKAQVLRG